MEVKGRFAPTPSGRMHLGNLMAALLAWLDVRSLGGTIVLRMEDLDPQRTSRTFAEQIVDDLCWLGLDWDEGGLEEAYFQSNRSRYYEEAFEKLSQMGLICPCWCSRKERLAACAPHRGEERRSRCQCAQLTVAERAALERSGRKPTWQVRVPDEVVGIEDGHMGHFAEDLRRDGGDLIVRRSDGVWAYQLAVVVDDALMGVDRVVRGQDLLSSAPRQAWLHRMLGHEPPQFIHFPLLIDGEGRRLSKRDRDLDMGALRERYTPEGLTGLLAFYAGLLDEPQNVQVKELVPLFTWAKVPKNDVVVRGP